MTFNKAMQQTKAVNLKIVCTGDVHGCFLPFDFIGMQPARGSLARVSSYVKKERQALGDRLLLIDNGDMLQGQPICNYFNETRTDVDNIAAQALNYMGYNACCIGNHDIETGRAVCDKWISETSCPVLAANMIDTETNKPYTAPYTMLERDGIRIAIIGMVTPSMAYWGVERQWNGVCFQGIMESARFWMERIKQTERPDLIVGLFHSGWKGGARGPLFDENETEKVAHRLAGFDVIFFGHDHAARCETITGTEHGKVLCVNPSCNAMAVGVANITIVKAMGRTIKKDISGYVLDIADEKPDESFTTHFSKQQEDAENYCRNVIGKIGTDIDPADCYFGNAPYTSLINDIQLDISHADISLCAPLSCRTRLSHGNICVSDTYKLYRYEDKLCVMAMEGIEVRKLLEMSYDLWINTMATPNDELLKLERVSAEDGLRYTFKNPTFNFDCAAGIDYEVDVTKPCGRRIAILGMAGGGKFSDRRLYRVAMGSFRANGGGELLTVGAGIAAQALKDRLLWQSDKSIRQYIAEHFRTRGTMQTKAYGNWHFAPKEWATAAMLRERERIACNDG